MNPDVQRSLRADREGHAHEAKRAFEYALYKEFDVAEILATIASLRQAEALERIADALERSVPDDR